MKRPPKTGLWNSLYEVAVLGLALAALVGVFCLLLYSTEPTREFFLKCVPLLEKIVWPCVLVVLLLMFHGEVKRALSELPGFVHRSNYGNYGGGDAIDGQALEALHYCDFEKTFTATGTNRVKEIVERMSRVGFTYAPLLDERHHVLKVFSLNRFVEELVTESKPITDDLTLDKLGIGFEDIQGFAFCSPDMSVRAFRAHYAFAWENGEEFKPVFITEDGKRDGELIGIATFWDSYLRK